MNVPIQQAARPDIVFSANINLNAIEIVSDFVFWQLVILMSHEDGYDYIILVTKVDNFTYFLFSLNWLEGYSRGYEIYWRNEIRGP